MLKAKVTMDVDGYDLIDKPWGGTFSGEKKFDDATDMIAYIEDICYRLKGLFGNCEIGYSIQHWCGDAGVTVSIIMQEKEVAVF